MVLVEGERVSRGRRVWRDVQTAGFSSPTHFVVCVCVVLDSGESDVIRLNRIIALDLLQR